MYKALLDPPPLPCLTSASTAHSIPSTGFPAVPSIDQAWRAPAGHESLSAWLSAVFQGLYGPGTWQVLSKHVLLSPIEQFHDFPTSMLPWCIHRGCSSSVFTPAHILAGKDLASCRTALQHKWPVSSSELDSGHRIRILGRCGNLYPARAKQHHQQDDFLLWISPQKMWRIPPEMM